MIITCCDITKYDAEIILPFPKSSSSVFYCPQSELILVRDSQLLLPTIVANN